MSGAYVNPGNAMFVYDLNSKRAVLVGVSYDADSKRHRCLIEKVEDYREMFGMTGK